jgi:AcrR family transcriptional regulator
MTTLSPSKQTSAPTKADILNSATRLFAAKGFRETTTSELAALTGVSEGTVFYHFKTKEGVLLAVLEKARSDLLASFEAHRKMGAFSSGMDLLADTAGFYCRLSGAMPETFRFLHDRLIYDLAAEKPVFREHLEAVYACLVDLFENAIRAGQADGSIVMTSARKSAMIVLAMVDGLVRFNSHRLYEAGPLYDELLAACRRMLESRADARPGPDKES